MFLLFFQPTFAQGLVIGQLSVLILLGMILKYLFLESSQYPIETASYHQVDNDAFLRKRDLEAPNINLNQDSDAFESTKWFNALLSQVRIFRQSSGSFYIFRIRLSMCIVPNYETILLALRETKLRVNALKYMRTPFDLLALWYVATPQSIGHLPRLFI
jgi:hypothetical protein